MQTLPKHASEGKQKNQAKPVENREKNRMNQQTASAMLAKAAEKFRKTANMAADANIIPYNSEHGQWVASPYDGNGWWTGGFWPALMWQLWRFGGDDFFKQEARRVEGLLTDEFRVYEHLNHDVGFMYLISCGADNKLTGNQQAHTDTMHAASLIMGRFNPTGFIRAWNSPDLCGYAIIDCMMNLSLLWWASRQSGDPRFSKVAQIHAATTMREFVRTDGSVSHIIEFDPETGRRAAEHPGQGYCLGSQWSRGQAWGLYGFTLAYLNDGNPVYLATAEKIAANFIRHIRADGLTDCDFCQPPEEERIDNIAGAVAACGLLELSRAAGNSAYEDAAMKLDDGMLTSCVDWSDGNCGLLTKCTASYHDDGAGRHTNITYGDYFLIEALAKIAGTDPMLWR